MKNIKFFEWTKGGIETVNGCRVRRDGKQRERRSLRGEESKR